MATAIHFSSKSDEWSTPQAFFDAVSRLDGPFDLDVCASAENAKCSRYFDRACDGLTQPWTGTCWMNPPYGREIGRWMQKAVRSAQDGAKVVCLVPARTDTAWWHENVINSPAAVSIRFIRGRLKFGNAKHSAPFPSAVVILSKKGAS